MLDAPAHFSGRSAELERVCAALTPAETDLQVPQVVTIQGMAGVGKSALAAAAAREIADQFPDGQLYLDLGGFGPTPPMSEEEALQTLLRGTGLSDAQIPQDLSDARALLRNRLAGRSMLVVLDNAVDIEQLKPLLPAVPTCATLAISRVMLTGLSATYHLQLGVLAEAEALELLREIVGPERIDAEPAAAAALIRSCGQLPLAIQIAAGRLVAEQSWRGRVPGRAAPGRTGPDRRTDRRPNRRRASLALSIGPGASTGNESGLVPAEAFAAIGLFDATELSAAAAAQLIDTTPPLAENLLEQMVDAHVLTSGPAAVERLKSEHASIMKLAAQLSAGPLDGPSDRSVQLTDLTIGLSPYFTAHGRSIDQMTLVQQALRHTAEPRRRAMLRCDLGAAQADQSLLAEELENLRQGAAEFSSIADHRGEAVALNNVCRILGFLGRFEEAIDHGERARDLHQEAGDLVSLALTLSNLGIFHCSLGSFEKGYDYFVDSLQVCEESGNESGRALALHNIGCAQLDLDRTDEAVSSLELAVELTRRTAMHTNLCNALDDLATAYRRRGDDQRALRSARESLDIAKEAADDFRQARANLQLGELFLQTSDPATARIHLTAALTFYSGRDDKTADRIEQTLATAS